MSQFDANVFLDAQQTEVNERRPPLPVENPYSADGLYIAQIGEITTASGTIEKGDRAGQPWLSMVVPLKIDVPPEMRDAMKLPPQVTLTDRAFVDLTPDGKGIDNSPGRNSRQKEYREAADMNQPGVPFSWRALTGKVVKVKVTHDMYEGNIQERLPKYGAIFKA